MKCCGWLAGAVTVSILLEHYLVRNKSGAGPRDLGLSLRARTQIRV